MQSIIIRMWGCTTDAVAGFIARDVKGSVITAVVVTLTGDNIPTFRLIVNDKMN